MIQPWLSALSAKARYLARRLARLENRPSEDILERAPEVYAERMISRESPAVFYGRLKTYGDSDVDLDAVIREQWRRHTGLNL
ncbi:MULTISPECIES: plasmid stabilization protein [Bradyrhizobium]|uniref:plasmid stabilization protein n=1 Tax=Bradyrhizobium TaxID=374 RepID=UPI000D3433B8|nr:MULTISPECIES: plasmid stabilization protein [Bradyrhizobium]